MTTPEHLRDSAWWPTKPLPTQQEFVGNQACAGCHADIVASQATSQMAHTLGHAADSAVLRAHIKQTYQSGPYTDALKQSARDLTLVVSDGAQTRSAALEWAFGSGDVGQSYLWKGDGNYREARFNYFAALHGFGATPGRLHGSPTSLDMALGRPLEEFEARTCFSCHTTTMSSASPINESSIVPGIGCEVCHGPGADHIAAAKAHLGKSDAWEKRILNSASLMPTQSVDFCGACHSTPADVRLMGAVGIPTVRFPAYRLEKSRCWGTNGDPRITCTGCHDPHEPLAHDPVAYDTACLSCHVTKTHPTVTAQLPGAACPVATSKCVTCHMPKYDLPEMHFKFTDHMIRVARANAPFPD